jgi:hypothetical protein
MRSLWLQASLAISIAFNIGLVIFMFSRPPAWHPRTPEDFLARIEGKMPAEDFIKLKAIMTESTPLIMEKRVISDRAMQDVVTALKAEPFDDNTLKSAMEAARIAHGESEKAFQDVILEVAPRLTHEGRATLVPVPHPAAASDHH